MCAGGDGRQLRDGEQANKDDGGLVRVLLVWLKVRTGRGARVGVAERFKDYVSSATSDSGCVGGVWVLECRSVSSVGFIEL